jgi:hypothetical protein
MQIPEELTHCASPFFSVAALELVGVILIFFPIERIVE